MSKNSAQYETHKVISLKENKMDDIIIPVNYLLCKPIPYKDVTDSGLYLGGLKSDQYMEKHTTRMYEVIKVPEALTFYGKHDSNARPLSWKTDMDLMVGDIVWATPFEAINAIYLRIEGVDYALIHYEEIRAAKRKGEVVTVNGFILCEQVEYILKSQTITYQKRFVDENRLKVLYPAKPIDYYIRQYKRGVYEHKYFDIHLSINSGDILVKYDSRFGTPLEGALYREFIKGTNVIYIQSRHIGGVETKKIE